MQDDLKKTFYIRQLFILRSFVVTIVEIAQLTL
jgi:hypothetical protein